ncbi:MAG: hypothetical protein AB7O45_04430 [Alphaproteobacteria bacterium]
MPSPAVIHAWASGSGLTLGRASTVALAAAATALLAVLHRDALVGCYGFLDDYALIDPARRFPEGSFLSWMLAEGRPLYGLLLNAAFLPISDVCDLRWLRLVNVALVALIGLQCHGLAVRGGWPRPMAVALSMLVLSAPGFAVAIAWATLIGPLAAIACGLAAARLASAPAGEAGPIPARRGTAAVALLIAGLALYQPGAMAFLPGLAIVLAPRRADAALLRAHVLPAGAVLAAAVGIYGVLFLLAGMQVDGDLVSTRAEIVHDPAGKAAWFVGVALRQSLNLFNIAPVPRFGFAIALLIVTGAWARQRQAPATALALALQAVAVVLAFLPNLTVQESWPSFRASLPMTMTIAVLAAAAAVALAERISRVLGPALAVTAIAGAAAYGMAATAAATSRGIVDLQVAEWSVLQRALRAIEPTDPRPIVLLRADPALPASCERWQRFDELAIPSSSRVFAAEGMRRLGWRAVHGGPPPDRFTIAGPDGAAAGDRIVIDLGAALDARADALCGG